MPDPCRPGSHWSPRFRLLAILALGLLSLGAACPDPRIGVASLSGALEVYRIPGIGEPAYVRPHVTYDSGRRMFTFTACDQNQRRCVWYPEDSPQYRIILAFFRNRGMADDRLGFWNPTDRVPVPPAPPQ